MKVKEPAQTRLERIQVLNGFGNKKTQVIQDKKKYNRKKVGKNSLPFHIQVRIISITTNI